MSNFEFLKESFNSLYEECREAEENCYTKPRTSVFYSRRALEFCVSLIFKNEKIRKSYGDNLVDLLNNFEFKDLFAEQSQIDDLHIVRKLGNEAVHADKTINYNIALQCLKILYDIASWFGYSYITDFKANEKFNETFIPKIAKIEDVKDLEYIDDDDSIEEKVSNTPIKTKVKIQKIKRSSTSERDTRKKYIDYLLKKSGWNLTKKNMLEYELSGIKSNKSQKGYADYILWGDDGLPLAVIEAKKLERNAKAGEHQVLEYAEALEKKFDFFPIRFCTNGYETYMYEDKNSIARQVYGFYRKEELIRIIKKREIRKTEKNLAEYIDYEIASRPYQIRAVTKVLENFYSGNRKSLLIMATGSGKTRVAISIVNSLSKLNMINRTLFLADRVSLVTQAMRSFKNFLPDYTLCNLINEKDKENAKIIFSTYQTMAAEVEKTRGDGTYKYGVGAFDLIIIDEAHRSVYQKYGDLFRYFDSLVLGLTATPKNEIDKNTFSIFEMDSNKPTDSYDLFEAAEKNHLVLPKVREISLNFPRNGIVYSKLSAEEKEKYESLFDNEEEMQEEISANSVNQWFFNKDTTRTVIQFLMEEGYKIENGDKIGKSIIFAKNDKHADHIVEVFYSMYKNKGNFCQKITTKVDKAQDLIDRFSDPKSNPQIAVSVDMLDTGIDIPEILNLVFYKNVKSKTKFWQMIGRGTRKSPNIFGTGKDKMDFLIFDFCENFSFFEMKENFKEDKGTKTSSLSSRIFINKLNLIYELQNLEYQTDEKLVSLREKLINDIYDDISSLNEENISVKMKIAYVKEYNDKSIINNLNEKSIKAMTENLSNLPFKSIEKKEDEKRFENFILDYQLRILTKKNTVPKAEKLREIYKDLSKKGNINEIKNKSEEILKVLKDKKYLLNLDILELEKIKNEITPLLVYLETAPKDYIFADLKDRIVEEKSIDIKFGQVEFLNLKDKFQKFLEENKDLLSIKKLKFNQELDKEDIKELKSLLYSNEEIDYFEIKKEYSNELNKFQETYGLEDSFGIFLRSLIGLDKESIDKEFSKFLDKEKFNSNQIELIEMIIKNFVKNGAFSKKELFNTSKDIFGYSLLEIFEKDDLTNITQIIDKINKNADFQIRNN